MDNDAREAYYNRITTPGYKSDYQKAAEAWAEYRNHRDEYNMVVTSPLPQRLPHNYNRRSEDKDLIAEMKKYQKIFGLRK